MKAGSKLVIHWESGFQDGMAYVMLGRCVKLEDIYIIGEVDPAGIKVNPEALAETIRLNNEFLIIKEEEESSYRDCFTISYLNINRLKPHWDDLISDHLLMKSDVLSLGETWLHPTENFPVPDGYEGSQVNIGDGKGVMAFAKQQHFVRSILSSSDTFSAILMETENIDMIFLYLSQPLNWKKLEEIFEKWIRKDKAVAVIGDMNIDFLDGRHKLMTYMEKNGFTQLVQKPTHEKGNLLDHIYVNAVLMQKKPFYSQRSCYYSDHDIIVLHVPLIRIDNK